MSAGAFRFPNVSCSQCGCDFGPGDSGFSSCSEHRLRQADLDRKADEAIQRGPQIAQAMGVKPSVKLNQPVDDGGPAFPFIEPPTECNVSEGMSLRDHFAAQALPAVMSCSWADFEYRPANGLDTIENTARLAYQIADAMLKARAAS